MKVATSRYYHGQLIVESGLVPVATTVGMPKFPLRYHLGGLVPQVAPHGIFGKDDLTERQFKNRYVTRLEEIGPDVIAGYLEAIVQSHDSHGVVLLCFCNLDEQFCHRRMFAEWWQTKTGIVVPELEPATLFNQEEE